MSTFSCLGCVSGSFDCVGPYRVSHSTHRRLFIGRELVRCTSCGLMQVFPVPTDEELGFFYNHEYRAEGFNAAIDLATYPYNSRYRLSRGRSLRQLVVEHASLGDGVKILEIGAGFGHNLFAFREKWPGCLLVANEGDPICRAALGKLDAAIVEGYWGSRIIRDQICSLGPFDVVLLSHVLEHPCNPRGFLQSVRQAVRPGNVVVIEVPNESADRVRRAANSPHITFFEKNTLRNFLQACGCTTAFLDTCGPPASSAASRPERLVRRLLPDPLKNLLKRFRSRETSAMPLTAEEIRDYDRVPIPYYQQYGDDRTWLRAVVRFG